MRANGQKSEVGKGTRRKKKKRKKRTRDKEAGYKDEKSFVNINILFLCN